MNLLWLVLFSCKTFFSRRRCHIRKLYVPSLWATSPVGQCLAGGICSSVGRWVAAPSETHPQRCGTSCSWLEHVNFNGRSYASKPILKAVCPAQLLCAPCSFFHCVSCLAKKTDPVEKGAWEDSRRQEMGEPQGRSSILAAIERAGLICVCSSPELYGCKTAQDSEEKKGSGKGRW